MRLCATAVMIVGLASATGASATPLQLEQFFRGTLTGRGEVDNYRDGTHRAFKASMKGSWAGERGTLVEDLAFEDGEKKHFVWTFERSADGRFVGHRADLINDADIFTDGDEVRMKYSAHTQMPDGKIWNLSFDDHLTQASPDTVTLRGDVSYLFVGVGVTRMTITRSGR